MIEEFGNAGTSAIEAYNIGRELKHLG